METLLFIPPLSSGFQKYHLHVDFNCVQIARGVNTYSKKASVFKELLHSEAGFYKDVRKHFAAMIHTPML